MLHDVKLRHNASETVANINKTWRDRYTSDRTVQRYFQKFRSVDQSLEDEKAEDGYAVLTMNNCKQLLSKIHDKVPKNV